MPRLRFKEFKNDWQLKTIGELGVFRGGGTPTTQNPAYWAGDIPWVSSSDLSDENIYDINISRKITQEAVANSATKVIPANSILIVSRVGVGKVAVSPSEICTSQDFSNLTLNSGDNVFFAYLIKNKTKNLLEFNQGTSIKGFVKSDLESYVIQHPSYEEQRKIASFLSKVDQKISLLTKKYELLAQYKKGVMQKIFNQEIRFKDGAGEDFPDWQSLTFDDVCVVNMGQSPESSSYNEDSFGMPLIQGNADISNRLTVPRVWTSQPTKTCDSGDLILTVRAPVGAVSKSTTRACIGRGVCSISPKENTSRDFLYQLLFWFESFKWKSIEQGSTFTAISGGDIRSLVVEFPCLEEQVEIAKFLDSLDLKINSEKLKLELIKQYKQGLLQQMFI